MTDLTDLVIGSRLSSNGFIIVTVLVYLMLGIFIDPLSMPVMTVPFIFPVNKGYGLDTIWFEVILCKMIEIAVITPPVGLILFAVVPASEGRVSVGDMDAGILTFVVIELIVPAILNVFPVILTYLPATMV